MEAGIISARRVEMAGERQFVLRLAGNAPLARHQFAMLAHRQARPRLLRRRGDRRQLAETEAAEGGELFLRCAGPIEIGEPVLEFCSKHDRAVGDRVGATGDAAVDLASGDLGAEAERRLQARAAGDLQIGPGSPGREAGVERRFTGHVEVAAVRNHRPAHDLAHCLALEAVFVGEAAEYCGEHREVRLLGKAGVGPRERNAGRSDDGDLSQFRHLRPSLLCALAWGRRGTAQNRSRGSPRYRRDPHWRRRPR